MNLDPQAIELIQTHSHFVLTSHVDPDGDGLGGILGLALALKSLGKTVSCSLSGGFQEKYRFLPGSDMLVQGLPEAFPKGKKTVLVSIDAAHLDRLGFDSSEIEALNPTVLNIDHHTSNKMFGDVNYFDSLAAASCEVIWHLIKELGVTKDSEMATALYCGLLTDTGRFRFSNTTERAMRYGAEMLGAGARHTQVVRKLFEENPWNKLHLESLVLPTLKREGKMAWLTVRKEMMQAAETDDTEDFVNKITEIKGMEIAILFKEVEPELTKISLRAVNNIDVNQIASVYGGGGHSKAAGAKLKMSLEAAIESVTSACRETLHKMELL
ncbi:MAG: bifunctional oligoribonuclease/PAP phosphatase NrnA [Candidatus Cloacimonetes bacterium]|nr:bifunctional oligoribonuclease/PAP phosphatase NrnA [Candidatus Cloacimonadota bacterium]